MIPNIEQVGESDGKLWIDWKKKGKLMEQKKKEEVERNQNGKLVEVLEDDAIKKTSDNKWSTKH
jgi:hypothetical protein